MDRSDERKEEQDTGILGLGGSEVPKEPGDPSTEYDPESVERRRHRIASEELEKSGTTAGTDHHGATGIDMGAGGQGTDVSGE